MFCLWPAKSQAMGLPPTPPGQGGRRRSWLRAAATPPSSNSGSNPQAVPLSMPRATPQGRPLRLPPLRLELESTRPPQKVSLREPNLPRIRRLRRRMTTTCTFKCHGRRWRQSKPGAPRRCTTMFLRALTVHHNVSQSAGPQNAAPVLQSVSVKLPAPASQLCL